MYLEACLAVVKPVFADILKGIMSSDGSLHLVAQLRVHSTATGGRRCGSVLRLGSCGCWLVPTHENENENENEMPFWRCESSIHGLPAARHFCRSRMAFFVSLCSQRSPILCGG